jgi:hypothetical protein
MGVAAPIWSASNKSIGLQVKIRKPGPKVEIAELESHRCVGAGVSKRLSNPMPNLVQKGRRGSGIRTLSKIRLLKSRNTAGPQMIHYLPHGVGWV